MTAPLPVEFRDFASRFVDDNPQIIGSAPRPSLKLKPRELDPAKAWQMNEAVKEGKKLTRLELLEVRKAYDPTDTTGTKADLIQDIATAKWVQNQKKEK